MRNLFFDGSLALLTDLYQLTMAFGYWKSGHADLETNFHLYFRKQPFQGGFVIACGLEPALEWIERFRFEADDLAYLATLSGADGQPLFDADFLNYLGEMRLKVDVDAMPEGTVCFAQEPLVRVQGPAIQCQLLETALLNIINFQTLIATKAARICLAAHGDEVLEFGARRAQGIDGALSASRAAFIGGCTATSNVLAGKHFGIPVRGTHAHSWVMLFDGELESFETYARHLPNNCVFLVDTYDTLEGVRQAVKVGRKLEAGGHELLGVRLDSGDLAYLSQEARKILDEAGFANVRIFASNDLDEHLIANLKEQGAAIGVWGVGTRLVTGHDQGALGGVFKLSATRRPGEIWQPRLKLSEQTAKISTPGVLQVRRYYEEQSNGGIKNIADAIHEEDCDLTQGCTIVDPADATRRRRVDKSAAWRDLLIPVMRRGGRVYQSPGLERMRSATAGELAGFHRGTKRLVNPHPYPAGLEARLHEKKTSLILKARERRIVTDRRNSTGENSAKKEK